MSSFGRPVCSEVGWVSHSVVFASGEDSVCIPLANEGVGFGRLLLALLPLALPPGIGLLRHPRGDLFHLGVFMRWSSTHGGLLAALPEVGLLGMGRWYMFQGASDSLPHSSPWGEVVASVFGIAVWALLQATSLPLGMDVSPAPGQSLSHLYLLRIATWSLRFLVLKCRVLTFSWVLTLSA